MKIIPYQEGDFDEVLTFMARLNDTPDHRIGYLEQGQAELAHDLAHLALPMSETFHLAYEDGRLVGAMGYDADEKLGKVWLLGPFVDHERWQETADALFAGILETLPTALTQLELYGPVENHNLETFAHQHRFQSLRETQLLKKSRPTVLPHWHAGVRDFDVGMSADVATLHESIFPNTYYQAEQLFNMIDDDHQLLVYAHEGRIVGYAFLQLSMDVGRAYLDFIGVADDSRGQGVGRALLESVIDKAFAQKSIDRLELTVSADNNSALRLYAAEGFEVVERMRGYRRSRVVEEQP